MGAGLAGIPPCLPHSEVLMGAGLAGGPPCLPHSEVLMDGGLAGRPPCLPHSQVLMGAGLAGIPPCLPHGQVLMSAGLAGRTPCLLHGKVLNLWVLAYLGDVSRCDETIQDKLWTPHFIPKGTTIVIPKKACTFECHSKIYSTYPVCL